MKNLFLAAAFLMISAGTYSSFASINHADMISITSDCDKCGKDHDGKKKCCKDKAKCDKETAHKCDKEKACCAKKEGEKEEEKKDDN